MSKYNNFLRLLEENKKYEIIAQNLICKIFNVIIKNECNDARYDFETSGNLKYEVKTDHLCNKTGNYYIEFMGYGKPSGISISEANFYILTNVIDYHLIETIKLKDICKNKKIVKTKDGLTTGFLVSTDEIKLNSLRL